MVVHRRAIYALIWMVVAILTSGAVWVVIVWTHPETPGLPLKSTRQLPTKPGYPGGSGCDPGLLSALPLRKRQREFDRCRAADYDYAQSQENLAQQRRAERVAEQEVLMAYAQARSSFVQTLATVAALLAAFWAAWAASRAAIYNRKALSYALESNEIARRQARPWLTPEPIRCEGVAFENGLMNITFTAVVKNNGVASASKVTMDFRIVWSKDEAKAYMADQEKLASSHRTKKSVFSGKMIAPGGEFRERHRVCQTIGPPIPKPGTVVTPCLIMDIAYSYELSEGRHKSIVAFDVWDKRTQSITFIQGVDATSEMVAITSGFHDSLMT
jgi:hypothetical protein